MEGREAEGMADVTKGDDLLPCPFCGSTEIHLTRTLNDMVAYCNTCGAHGELAETLGRAWEKWNTRAPSP
jgi:Lar family restriction alleviation protein